VIINGVAVVTVTAPAEIDAITAGQVRIVLLDAGSQEQVTVVVDMSRTWFCDSAVGLAGSPSWLCLGTVVACRRSG
jgi:anti-anti-sigma regulatory factor